MLIKSKMFVDGKIKLHFDYDVNEITALSKGNILCVYIGIHIVKYKGNTHSIYIVEYKLCSPQKFL